MYLDGGMGGGGWLLTSFFSIIYILGLVCYKHTIHVLHSPKTGTIQGCLLENKAVLLDEKRNHGPENNKPRR